MCDSEDFDSDTTVVDEFNVQELLKKYENVELLQSPKSPLKTDSDDDFVGKRLKLGSDEFVSEAKPVIRDVDDILEELTKKYNMNFEESPLHVPSGATNSTSPITLSDDDSFPIKAHKYHYSDFSKPSTSKNKFDLSDDESISQKFQYKNSSKYTLSDDENTESVFISRRKLVSSDDDLHSVDDKPILKAKYDLSDEESSPEKLQKTHNENCTKLFNKNNAQKVRNKYCLSDDDDDDDYDIKKYTLPKIGAAKCDKNDTHDLSPIENYVMNSFDDDDEVKKVATKKMSKEEKAAQRVQAQLDRQKEREKKKEEAERSKQMKKAFATANKNMKPEECIKFITAIIDNEILSNAYGNEIGNQLDTLGAKYSSQSQIMPNTVTWIRKLQSHLIDDDGKLSLRVDNEDVQQMLLILTWREAVELVNQNMLLVHIKGIHSVFENKRLSLCIYEMDGYFRYHKNAKKNEVHNAVTGANKTSKPNKEFAAAPKITRKQLEYALTELQIMCSCCYRFTETPYDVALMVSQFTKSIAQAPYKLEKQEKYKEAAWYMAGDNKDCVRVDKDGNGLRRLWQQQITSFPLARVETAEAIIEKYPTLSSLFMAYENCETGAEKEKLIQEIPIRRAAGLLAASRKIGPELSKKMNIFYNSDDGDAIL